MNVFIQFYSVIKSSARVFFAGFLLLEALCFNDVSATVDNREFKRIHFDQDPNINGLDYLNISDDHISMRKGGTAGSLEIGEVEAYEGAPGRNKENIPKLLYPAMAGIDALINAFIPPTTIALAPIMLSGGATEFKLDDKQFTNRPRGVPRGMGHGLNRNLGTLALQRYEQSQQYPNSGTREARLRQSRGTWFSGRPRMHYVSSGGDDLVFQAYETNLPEKVNTNRPRGRSGGGRGISRELYPAHPDSP